jgi:leucyl/phenylalanyl-tRNA--protein transferase
MPLEPPPTIWTLPRPPADHPEQAWAIGADLEPGTLLAAYRTGIFPMRVEGDLVWWSPPRRAVIPLEGHAPSRSLRRAARGFAIHVDRDFAGVIRGCADPARPHGWIDDDFVRAYTRLHELGWAHSVEAWDAHGLAGGLYGVACGGLFAAESMFFRRSGASKAAVLGLIRLLRAAGGPRLLDVQWSTPHLASLGAVEIERAEYHRRLDAALPLPDAWGEASASPSRGSAGSPASG